jgi:hypothetical protein
MILDVIAGVLAALDAISHWRFMACFVPAAGFALFLFFSVPEKLAAVALSTLVLVTGALVGTVWELTVLRKKKSEARARDIP